MKIQATKILTRIKEYIKNDPFILIITLFFIAFTIYWSYIAIMKLYAILPYVWDLGVAMNNAWIFINNPFNVYPNEILLIIFPIFLPKSFQLILAFQAAFITFGIFPLYGIGKHMLKSKTAAFFIAISYLFYPFLIGDYWYDFHFQALFPTLFFIGYYFYIKNKYKYSVLFLILAGLTRYPYIVFILLFSIIILIENIFNFKFSKNNYNSKNLKFAILILILSLLIIFIYNYNSFFNIEHLYGVFKGNAHFNENINNPFYQIDNKIFILLLLFLPFLGLPLLSKRFIILYLPFIYTLFYSNFWGYEFPWLFHLQYAPLIFPFLYLGTIDSLSYLAKKYDKTISPSPEKIFKKFKNIFLHPKVKISATIFILVILLATVYQPYGPVNEYSQANTNLSWISNVNMTTFNNLEHIVNMIPENDPYVLTQNNIPEIYPRPGIYEATPLTTANYFFNNLTLNNHYFRVTSGHIYNARIDYVLAYIENGWYYVGSESMYNFTTLFYGSGEYGILAEASGFVLLQRNYTGPIEYYVPMSEYFSAKQLSKGPSSILANGTIYANNITSWQPIWFGPYITLPPGVFNITFQLETTNNSPKNLLELYVSNITGGAVLSPLYVSGLEFSSLNTWVNITLTFNNTNFLAGAQFVGYSSNWIGKIAIKGIYLTQVAPP